MHLFLLLLIALKGVSSQVIIQDELNDGRNFTVSNCSPRNTDWLVWQAPLANFHKHRELGSPDCFDWTSDGCTSSPNHLFGFNFQDACQRHDFAYRNLGHQARLTSDTRQEADKNFLNDLKAICMKASHGKRPLCTLARVIYFSGVRLFGSPDKAMYAFVGAVMVYVVIVGLITYWMVVRHRKRARKAKHFGTHHSSMLSTPASSARSRSPDSPSDNHSGASSSILSSIFFVRKP
ncbi:phospholipase A2 [Venturia nashicola]|uniref:Phospholipase A2 n=1 Tax=Venturia nashicola TaxID=86259 RepID=A0A4Z1P3A7_9PEZI|nr:phospholipase A2 [Venturia nashicola]TLD23631.1 phospholipase A2 [Venturia nashicola]